MAKKKQKMLFYSLFTAFILIGVSSILYAQGWRLNIKTFTFEKTGAIYLERVNKESRIYLDGKEIKNNSGILSSGILISNLLPKNYNLKITMPGYYGIHRTIQVKPSIVSKIRNPIFIKLAPEKILNEPIKNFWIISGKLILLLANNNIMFEGQKINGDKIIDINKNSKSLITEERKTGKYFLNNLRDGSSINLDPIFKKLNIKIASSSIIKADASSNSKLIVESSKSLKILDAGKKSESEIYNASSTRGSIKNISVSRFRIAWDTFDKSKNESTLNIYDRFFDKKTDGEKTVPGRISKLKWVLDNELAILTENGDFYVLNPNKSEVKLIANDVKNFDISSNNLAALLENNGLEIISINSSSDYRRFNIKDIKDAMRIRWYHDGQHIFLIYKNKIDAIDIDDLRQENIIHINGASNGKYSENLVGKLYFLNKENILSKIDIAE